MNKKLILHPDRLFSSDQAQRNIARRLYKQIKDLPIISPHGHTDPSWFASNAPFENAADLIIKPDHYIFRMLYSQGIQLSDIGILRKSDVQSEVNVRKNWHLFADNYYLFRGTPSRMWLDMVFADVFGFDVVLSSSTADHYYDVINEKLKTDAFRPRTLFDRFKIELLSTTESPLDDLRHHQTILESGWNGQVISAFRPDPVVDPEFEGFSENVVKLGEMTGEAISHYDGYLKALMARRAYFKKMGATATDHGHPTPYTADLPREKSETLYQKILSDDFTTDEAEQFRGQMLTESAAMSMDDGLVMQIHPGSFRNHNPWIFENYGRDKGADIPRPTEYVHNLKALLDRFGNESSFTLILFTLDETSYSRELATMAGHYPCLRLGPPWWFHDSPEGMRRFRQQTTETAGFYNTVGFNDDTRAFLSIPARHDVARRMDCNWLAELVADHRLDENEASELAVDLTYNLVKKAYKL